MKASVVLIIAATLVLNILVNLLILVNPMALWYFNSYDVIAGVANIFLFGVSWWFYTSTQWKFEHLKDFFELEYKSAFSSHNGLNDPMAAAFLSTEPGKFIEYHRNRASKVVNNPTHLKVLTAMSGIALLLSFFDFGFLVLLNSLVSGAGVFKFYMLYGLMTLPLAAFLSLDLIRNIKDFMDMRNWENNLFIDYKKKSKLQDPKFDETFARQEILTYFGVEDISKIKDLMFQKSSEDQTLKIG